jgi:hypothetical protein
MGMVGQVILFINQGRSSSSSRNYSWND